MFVVVLYVTSDVEIKTTFAVFFKNFCRQITTVETSLHYVKQLQQRVGTIFLFFFVLLPYSLSSFCV